MNTWVQQGDEMPCSRRAACDEVPNLAEIEQCEEDCAEFESDAETAGCSDEFDTHFACRLLDFECSPSGPSCEDTLDAYQSCMDP
jgi:hypothetical protein